MFGKDGLGGLLGQAQKMREEFQRIQDGLSEKTAEGSAGGGMVKVVVNGKNEVLSVTLDPEMMKLQDRDMLQDLIRAGVNEAIKSSKQMVSDEMGKLTGGLGPLASMLKGFGA
jgi:DNA-binding YbaB/EbfC family protein